MIPDKKNNKPDAPFLIMITGSVREEGERLRGDYGKRFSTHMGLSEGEYVTHYAYENTDFPVASDFAGIVVSGARCMVTEHLEWSEKLAVWLREAIESGVPVFGSCYGHQLIAYAFGAEIGLNPNGPEFGTPEIYPSNEAEADPIFGLFEGLVRLHETHFQSVLRKAELAEVMGGNDHDPYQMFKYGEHCWTTQAHPESVADDVTMAIASLEGIAEEQDLDLEAMRATIIDSEDGPKLLQAFRDYCRAESMDSLMNKLRSDYGEMLRNLAKGNS